MSVSLVQPMREAEIDLVKLANANEAAIAQEILDRKAADTTLQSNIDAEASAREAADATLQNNIAAEATARDQADSRLQNNINAEETERKAADTTLQNNIAAEATARDQADSRLQAGINGINAKFPVAASSIADSAVTSDKIANGTISTIDLDEGIQNQLSFIASVPDLEFGTSDSFDVQANGYYDCTVAFTAAKTGAPIVICGLQHASGSMACIVTSVTNQQFNARVFNLTTTGITAAKLDWLAISGR